MRVAYKRLSSDCYCRWYTGGDDGIDTDTLVFTYELLHKAGFLRTLFYDRDVPGIAEYLDFITQPKFLVFVLYANDGTPLGMSWLEEMTATGAQRFGHFTTFDTVKDHSIWIEGGRALCRFVRDAIGLQQLIGLTPACYRHALKAAYAFGYKPVATLKKAVYCLGKQRDAILSVNDLSEL